MTERICIVGLDPAEAEDLRRRLNAPTICHDVLPRIAVRDGVLFVSSPTRGGLVPVSKMIFHGLFEDDFDFVTALALWGGPCFPNARAMMECRLKFPCLVRALLHTRFGSAPRGYAGPDVEVDYDDERVAKWGNWHCGENKERFMGRRRSAQSVIIEPFLKGRSVRVMIIGERAWQIALEGADWLKSVHDPQAVFMGFDPELVKDTRAVAEAFGLEIAANDYIVAEDGGKHLLEVNHIPNVTRFPEIWEVYRDYVTQWSKKSS